MTERALEQYQSALLHTHDPALISESLRRQAHVHRVRCDWELAIEAARQSAEAAESALSTELVAEAWNAEAAVYQSRGDFDAALPLYQRMLDSVPVGRIRGVALQNMAAIHARRGQLDDAERHFERALAAFEEASDRCGMGYVLNNLGCLALDRGDAHHAEDTLQIATILAREIQDLELLAITRLNTAETLLALGEMDKAEMEASGSLGHFVTAGNEWRRTECLRLLGDIAVRQRKPDAARRFYEAGLALAESIGARVELEQLRGRLDAIPPDESVAAS